MQEMRRKSRKAAGNEVLVGRLYQTPFDWRFTEWSRRAASDIDGKPEG
jgi:hypothetical protein